MKSTFQANQFGSQDNLQNLVLQTYTKVSCRAVFDAIVEDFLALPTKSDSVCFNFLALIAESIATITRISSSIGRRNDL